ncbi:MFS transporter [Nocardioides sp. GY 10113]|uniref:MFS transporter n=1 Tax=Nocardioides sp. GY 10113 TaxID=2569761 RepID=UPI0010A7F94D|nr:MFS transporter [Nocardioides sp. GY 10113]TIC80628.1 MFS transporter [Nocardioides sp. GY 10113]
MRHHDDRSVAQRRTVRVLVLTQAVGAIGITIGIATASLLARDLSGSEALSGLAQTSQVLGAAVISFLLAGLMARRGRRFGLCTGYLLGASGGGLVVLAGVLGSMVLLLAGAVLLGAATAANSAARYAATDLATDENRARSLSLVVWATTVGAVAGPNLSGPAGSFARTVGIPELAGPFAIAAVGMLAAAIVVGVGLRPDPLLLAQRLGESAVPHAAVPVRRQSSWTAARAAIGDRPVLGYAIGGLAMAHAAMVGVMVMTPLHMEHGGAELEVIGLVISGHVLGMFAFSPLVGVLADRLGRPPVLGLGGFVLVAALLLCASSPDGMSWQVSSGLFLLGVGWSLAMVSASTLVAEHAPLAARTAVQGTSDLVMGMTAAGAGAAAGLVVDLAGYPTLALVTLALALGVVGAAVRAHAEAPLPAADAPDDGDPAATAGTAAASGD